LLHPRLTSDVYLPRERQEVNGIGTGLQGNTGGPPSNKKSWLNRVRFKKGKPSGNSDLSDSESATSTPQVGRLFWG